LKEYGYEQYMDSTFFAITTTSEDWAGFKANLDRTNYPEDVKRQVIEIISAGLKEDEKERRVMALVGGAQEVEFILAPLRRATIKMSGESGSHSDEQIQAFATEFIGGKKSTEEFDNFFEKEELLYTVEKSENKAAQKRLLKEFIRKYSDDFRGYLNLAVLELQDGNADEALSLLEKADKLSPNNAMIANNLGVVYLEKGNYEAGLAKLQEAYAARTTPELAFNMGVLNHKKAEYGAAVEMFEKAGDLGCAHYNAGLGKLLQGDLAGAKSELEAAIRSDKDRALNYYVMAIVGAQSADANLMSVNLKRAVTLDSALGKKAQKDLEFRRFWDNAEFQAAVNN
jgi:Tfp pilus assembly protein PilF